MTTMTVSLPATLSTFVEDEVAARGYESGAEYIRALVREQQARKGLREALLDGAASGLGTPVDAAYFQGLRDRLGASRTAAE